MKGIVCLLTALVVAVCAVCVSPSDVCAQQCNVQSSNSQSLSSAAAVQDLVRAVQLSQLQTRIASPSTAAVASAGGALQAPQLSASQVNSLLSALAANQQRIQAPTASATASAGAVPVPALSSDQLLSALSANLAAPVVQSAGCSSSRSRAVTRTLSAPVRALTLVRPSRSISRSSALTIQR